MPHVNVAGKKTVVGWAVGFNDWWTYNIVGVYASRSFYPPIKYCSLQMRYDGCHTTHLKRVHDIQDLLPILHLTQWPEQPHQINAYCTLWSMCRRSTSQPWLPGKPNSLLSILVNRPSSSQLTYAFSTEWDNVGWVEQADKFFIYRRYSFTDITSDT